MENPIKMDDLGGTTIFGNTHLALQTCRWLRLREPPTKITKKTSGWIDSAAVVNSMVAQMGRIYFGLSQRQNRWYHFQKISEYMAHI